MTQVLESSNDTTFPNNSSEFSCPSESGDAPKNSSRIGVIEVIWEYPLMTGAFEYFLQIGRDTGICWVKHASILSRIRGLRLA